MADSSTLIRIKKLIISGHYRFTLKAELERESDHLSKTDVLEAIINAPAISKTIRSRSKKKASRKELLYVIKGMSYSGLVIYTKGTIRKIAGEDTFYLLVSSKRSIEG